MIFLNSQRYIILPYQAKAKLIAEQNEAVGNDIVASSHIESKALQLFLFADREDRAGNFDV